jgi:predicted HAD superfamily hydrolase
MATCTPFRVNPSPLGRSLLTIWIIIKFCLVLFTTANEKKKKNNLQLININPSPLNCMLSPFGLQNFLLGLEKPYFSSL